MAYGVFANIEEFAQFLPKISGDIKDAFSAGLEIGLNKWSISVLRTIFGFSKKAPKQIEKEKIEKIMCELKKGIPAPQIAKNNGISQSKIYQLARRRKINSNICHDFWDEIKIRKLISLYNQGLSNQEVADNLGCTYAAASTMKQHLIHGTRSRWLKVLEKCGGINANK